MNIKCEVLKAFRKFACTCLDSVVRRYLNEHYSLAELEGSNAILLIRNDLIRNQVFELSKHDLVFSGLIAGWIVKNDFVPSPWIFEKALRIGGKIGCAVEVLEQGVKAFLYGNDILIASVKKFLHPVRKGMYVAVLDAYDGSVIGVGKLVKEPNEIEELHKLGRILEVAIENVFDLGLVLRSERSLLKFQPGKLKLSRK